MSEQLQMIADLTLEETINRLKQSEIIKTQQVTVNKFTEFDQSCEEVNQRIKIVQQVEVKVILREMNTKKHLKREKLEIKPKLDQTVVTVVIQNILKNNVQLRVLSVITVVYWVTSAGFVKREELDQTISTKIHS